MSTNRIASGCRFGDPHEQRHSIRYLYTEYRIGTIWLGLQPLPFDAWVVQPLLVSSFIPVRLRRKPEEKTCGTLGCVLQFTKSLFSSHKNDSISIGMPLKGVDTGCASDEEEEKPVKVLPHWIDQAIRPSYEADSDEEEADEEAAAAPPSRPVQTYPPAQYGGQNVAVPAAQTLTTNLPPVPRTSDNDRHDEELARRLSRYHAEVEEALERLELQDIHDRAPDGVKVTQIDIPAPGWEDWEDGWRE